MSLLGNDRKPVSKTFVLDNGSADSKLGWAHDQMKSMPNAIMRTKAERRNFIGDQISEARDFSQMYFKLPHEKGYLVDFDLQHQIWDYVFQRSKFDVVPSESNIIITQPPNTPGWTQKTTDEVLFEEYGFSAMIRTQPTTLALCGETIMNPEEVGRFHCSVVVDSGFSFTHIVPYVNGQQVMGATRRIDIGGKHLTNYLKEVVSYGQVNVLEDTIVMDHCKTELSFVSTDFDADIERCRLGGVHNTIVKEYVLPGDRGSKVGSVRDVQAPPPKELSVEEKKAQDPFITLSHERFTGPELLFNPSNVGVNQCGIPEAIVDAIAACPEDVQPHLFRCILLVGGNTAIKGYKERIERELRQVAPQDFEVNVFAGSRPIFSAWLGGAYLAANTDFLNTLQSKEDYLERGTVYNE